MQCMCRGVPHRRVGGLVGMAMVTTIRDALSLSHGIGYHSRNNKPTTIEVIGPYWKRTFVVDGQTLTLADAAHNKSHGLVVGGGVGMIV